MAQELIKKIPKDDVLARVTTVDGMSFPVLKVEQFLSASERDMIFQMLCSHQHLFDPRPNASEPCVYYLSAETEVLRQAAGKQISSVYQCLSEQIKLLLPQVMPMLGVDEFTIDELPITFINGITGQYALPHTDECGGKYQLSFLYYLHNQPKAFSGGELEFYNSNSCIEGGHDPEPIGKLEHQDNLLVVFPSKAFHGVTPVTCSSEEFVDGRMVALGFIGAN